MPPEHHHRPAASWGELALALRAAAQDARRTADSAHAAARAARAVEATLKAEVSVALEASLQGTWKAEEAAAQAAAAEAAASRLAQEAQHAAEEAKKVMQRRDGHNPSAERRKADGSLEYAPTGGHRVPRGLWDVHVAVHCATPTGNVQPPTVEDAELELVESTVLRACTASKDVERLRRQVHECKEEWKRLTAALERAEKAEAEAQAEELTVREWKVKASTERRSKKHDKSSTFEAWTNTLRPLEAKLHQLHERGDIECAVMGFVRSDAEAWRRFWMRRQDGWQDWTQSGVTRLACRAPKECGCALCANRAGGLRRSGARESMGKDGAFVSADGIGTRLSGVVRVRALSPGAAMDALTLELVSSLHEAHGPVLSTKGKDVSDRPDLVLQHRLYDVTWSGTSNAASLDGALPYGPHVHDRTVWSPLPESPERRRMREDSRHQANAELGMFKPFSPELHLSHRMAGAGTHPALSPPQPTAPGGCKPCLTNPHSALVLDLQLRLMRTTGTTFSYLSGRAQEDTSMPWFGVGREVGGFEADKRRVGVSYRPERSHSFGGRRSRMGGGSMGGGGIMSPSRGGSVSPRPRSPRGRHV